MATMANAPRRTGDAPFFVAAALAMSTVVLVGFGSWGLRGMVNYAMLPVLVHVHALAFAGWMLVYLVQSVLAARGSMTQHRLLGWCGAGLAVVIIVRRSLRRARS